MKLEMLFEKFELLAEAPDALTRMRGLILRLAMQGRLTERHTTDGSVDSLLREIEKDKVLLGSNSSAKSGSTKSSLVGGETKDAVPAEWTWMRFGDIARHNAGKTLDKGRNRGKLRDYITTSNLYWGFFQLDSVRQMPIMDDEVERCTAIKGDLLICEGGEAGRAAVWPHDNEISFQNHVHRARFFGGMNPYFVQRYFEKLNATGEINKYRKGVGISNMSGKALASIPIPIPTLAEQKRIVAKVDELMALCDRMEAQQQQWQARHTDLARASLSRFAKAPTPANLDFLFHHAYDITPADLRKSILTLAVQGKLVPQDPDEKPATQAFPELKPLRIETSENVAVPHGWELFRYRSLTSLVTSGSRGWKEYYAKSGAIFVRTQNIKTDKLVLDDIAFVDLPKSAEGMRAQVLKDDILITITGANVTKAARVVEQIPEAYVSQHIALTRPRQREMSEWLHLCFISHGAARGVLEKLAYGDKPGLNLNNIRDLELPIPPLAEQRRIVAKVDQLMALVDQLEAQLAVAQTTAREILDAVVAEITASA
jgi:type I restriction enzyme S subunit